MLKKFGVLAVALAVGGMLALSGTAMAAKGFKHLSFMGSYLEKHPTVVNYWEPYFKATDEKFGGKLTFDYFSTNSLYPESEAPQAITDGRVDFGVLRPSVYPGKYNLLNVVAIPGMCPNAIVGSLVLEDIIQKFPEVRAELPRNTVHLTAWASDAYQIHSLMPIRTREDLKGRKIAVWDRLTKKIAEDLGAHPILMSSTDTFISLSHGMVDGVLCPMAPLRSYKLTDEAKYHLILGIGVNTFVEAINKKSWDSLTPDMQKWISSQGGMKMAEAIGLSLMHGAITDAEWMKSQGHEFIVLSDEERSAFLEPLDVFADEWKKEVGKKLGSAVVDKVYKYARERSAYYTREFHAGKYGDFKI